MSRKFSEARCAAFLRAVAETGNQTLAAERAKVSRSWVQLQRSTDPQFKAEVAAAVAEARASLSQRSGSSPEHSGRQPPSGWGFLGGEELVVKGIGGAVLRPRIGVRGRQAQDERRPGRRVQIARARVKQWTPRVEQRFLGALMATCNVKAACAEVGMTAASAYAHRKRWPRFASLWEEAIAEGYVNLEVALIQNAQNLFSADALPPETVLRGMDVAQAIHLLHMHKHGVLGLGKAPGKSWRPPPTLADLKPGMLRTLWAWEVARAKAGRPVRPDG